MAHLSWNGAHWDEASIDRALPKGKITVSTEQGEPLEVLDYSDVKVVPDYLPVLICLQGLLRFSERDVQRHGIQQGTYLRLKSGSGHSWLARVVEVLDTQCIWRSEGVVVYFPDDSLEADEPAIRGRND